MSDITKRTTTTPTATPTALSPAAAFLDATKAANKTKAAGRGRLIFALDATASREPLWNTARRLQADMFYEVAAIGQLDVQLVYYRDLNECRSSRWVSRPEQLADLMGKIECRSGTTQINRVLNHAKRETQTNKVQALVFVGDAMEERLGDLGLPWGKGDDLSHAASELGRLNTPAFMFQENDDARVEYAFREIARLSRGAYARFDPGAADQLRELLRGAAIFAAGGVDALRLSKSTASATKLLSQLK